LVFVLYMFTDFEAIRSYLFIGYGGFRENLNPSFLKMNKNMIKRKT
jgi:hypothetical protein